MIHIRSANEIEKISKACQIVKETLELIEETIAPDVTLLELDIVAENFIRSKGAEPGFKGLYGSCNFMHISGRRSGAWYPK